MTEEHPPLDDQPMPPGFRDDIHLTIEGGTLDGYIQNIEGESLATLDHVEVEEFYRGSGKAMALVTEFAQRAIDGGAVQLSAIVTVPPLARIMGAVFGGENIVCSVGRDNESYVDVAYEDTIGYLSVLQAMTDHDASMGVDTPDTERSGVTMVVSLTQDEVRARLNK